MDERHLTIQELAGRLRVPVQTVYKWNTSGAGPAYMRIGRHVRYRLADVLAWEQARLKAGREPATGKGGAPPCGGA